jgi:predicted TIM-barrel fold metal-dependent hydrolase
MPYLSADSRHTWFRDEQVLDIARRGLEEKQYYGIGEFHLVAGMSPNPKHEHKVIDGLMRLAAEFDVPVNIHTEASSYQYFLPLCKRHPRVRILWAHAGGILPPAQVSRLMQSCANVWIELAARDDDRYYDTPIVDERGKLLAGWRQLILEHPDRVMTGSDPVWPVDGRHRWDEPDSGWERIGHWLAFHRNWIAQLPAPIARKVRLENALAFYRISDSGATQIRAQD